MTNHSYFPAGWLFVEALETSPVNELAVTLKGHDLVSTLLRFSLTTILTALGNPITVTQFKALSGYAMGVQVGYWKEDGSDVSIDAYAILSAVNAIDPKTYPEPNSDAPVNVPALKACEFRPVYLVNYREDQTDSLTDSPVKWAYVDYGMKP